MKKIKNYKNFIKESVRDRMTPKSKEEVEKEIEKLDSENKLLTIFRYNMEDNYTKSKLRDLFFDTDPERRMWFYSNKSYKDRIKFVSEEEIKETIKQIDNTKQAIELMYDYGRYGVRTLQYGFTEKEVIEMLDKLEEGEKLDLILTYQINYPKEKMEKLIHKSTGEQEITEYKDIIGKTLSDVKVEYYDPKSKSYTEDRITFTFEDGDVYTMYHNQDCCESVHIDDVDGEVDDLVGEPLRVAEEVSSRNTMASESGTWTFYKFATIKGYVTIRWYGSSNGYYSERVSFEKTNREYEEN